MASKWIGTRWEKLGSEPLSGVIVGEVTIAGKLGPYKNLVIRYSDGAEANTTLGILKTYFKLVPAPESSPVTLFGLLPEPVTER